MQMPATQAHVQAEEAAGAQTAPPNRCASGRPREVGEAAVLLSDAAVWVRAKTVRATQAHAEARERYATAAHSSLPRQEEVAAEAAHRLAGLALLVPQPQPGWVSTAVAVQPRLDVQAAAAAGVAPKVRRSVAYRAAVGAAVELLRQAFLAAEALRMLARTEEEEAAAVEPRTVLRLAKGGWAEAARLWMGAMALQHLAEAAVHEAERDDRRPEAAAVEVVPTKELVETREAHGARRRRVAQEVHLRLVAMEACPDSC